MRICVLQFVHRYQVIEKLVEDWKSPRLHASSPTFLTALVPECADVAELYRQAWEYVRELIQTDPNGDEIDEVGKILKHELPRILAVFQWIQEMMAGANRGGAMIKNAAAFDAAVKQVREISARIEKVYPELNQEMAEASMAEYERGEYQTIEDLIREIQGHSAPAH